MGVVSQAGMASLFAVMLAVGYESGVHADAVTGPSIVSPPVPSRGQKPALPVGRNRAPRRLRPRPSDHGAALTQSQARP